MAKAPDWTPFLEAGMEFTEMTRTEARRRARRLVKEGQLAQDRAQAFVDEMVESSRRRADELLGVVRTEFQRQVDALGLATKEDLAALEDKLAAGETSKDKKSKDKKDSDKKSKKHSGKKDKKAKDKAKNVKKSKDKAQKASQGQASLAQVRAAKKKAKKTARVKKSGPSHATVRRNAARKAGPTSTSTSTGASGTKAKTAAKRPNPRGRTPRGGGSTGAPPADTTD